MIFTGIKAIAEIIVGFGKIKFEFSTEKLAKARSY